MAFFVCSYDSLVHCQISQAEGVLGFHTENTGTLGSLRRLAKGDRVLLRNTENKTRMSFFGLFRVTDTLSEVDAAAPKIWPIEKARGRVIFNLRVPAAFSQGVDRELRRQEVLRLGWKKRYRPYTPYTWQGYAKLFAGNFLEPDQEAALCELLELEH